MSTLPLPQYDVSVILVNYNTAHLLERCLGDLRRASGGLKVQTLIVDNASKDDSVAVIRERFPDCELIVNEVNVGFGRANNQALPRCAGRYCSWRSSTRRFSARPFAVLLSATGLSGP